MSKHFGKFITEAQYTAGQSSLDFPNVSLVEQTGNIHYSVAVGPTHIWDANFGDILLYDVDNDDLLIVVEEEYNTTDCPTNNFQPIGVCIFDRASYPGNKTLFMSLKWMASNNPDNGVYQLNSSGHVKTDYYLIKDLSNIENTDNTNYIDTKKLNNDLLELCTGQPNWKTDSTLTTTNNNSIRATSSPLIESGWRFHTNGTNQGDWCIPSVYDFTKVRNNWKSFKTLMSDFKTKWGVSFSENLPDNTATCNSRSNAVGNCYSIDSNGNINPNFSRSSGWTYARAVYFAGPEEL